MIKVKKSPTADTRTCDCTKVSKEELKKSSVMHIDDVKQGLKFFMLELHKASEKHDFDKLTGLDHFHSDFKTNFKECGWWDNHRKVNRHHIDKDDGVPDDVNLVDVIEHLVDCVMAGMARSGSVYDLKLPEKVLQKAFKNTVEMLKDNVKVAK